MNTPAPTLRHQRVTDPPAHIWSRRRSSTAATAVATAGILGGLALFSDLSLHLFSPLGRSYFLVATVMALCLLGVPIAYWLRGTVAGGWRGVIAVVGTAFVVLGVAAWITAFLILFNDPAAAFSQRLTPAGSVLMAVGMLPLGTGVLASRRLSGLRSVAPLVVGAYFHAQLIIQLTFFLNGRDAAPGPNGALLGVWGLLWAGAAWATTARKRQPNRP